jgi:hypothetical protein
LRDQGDRFRYDAGVTRRPALVFLATGLCVLGYLWLTVHRRTAAEFAANPGAVRTRIELTQWLGHGYFASYGLLMPTADPHVLYRSSTGAHRITGYLVALAGFDAHAQALHNQLVSLLTSVLLALLAYRLALRLGAEPLHAIALAIAAQLVLFTFPDNLALYWDMTAQAYWLIPALAFLLIEERAVDGRTRRLNLAQALTVFAMTYVEYVCATMFLLAYLLALILLKGDRPPLKRLVLMLAVPWLAAVALFGLQLALAGADPQVKLVGSRFLYRTGLDGDAELYGTPLDIAFGRDIVRAQRPAAREQLFHWPLLFGAGVAAVLLMLLASMRGRVPRIAVIPLIALLGSYLLYAGVFSQAVALHPYLYDSLLAAPLVLALFALAPALLENRGGLITLVTFLSAAWVTLFQLRVYAMAYPLR